MDRVLVLDGLNFIYRGNVKFGPSDKITTESHVLVFNFMRNLRSLVEQFTPDKIFFVREGAHNFRKELSADYKANRLIKQGMASTGQFIDWQQVKKIYELLQYLPLTMVNGNGVEGDDLVASLVENLRSEHCTIVSNDNDFIQLLQRGYTHVELYDPYKKRMVKAPPYLHTVFKCLYGDTSDNIPRLLPKKKAELIASNPHLLATFLSTEEHRANFEMNRQLIELRLLPDTDLLFEDGTFNPTMLQIEFRHLDFKSLLRWEYWDRFKRTFNIIHL